MKRIIIYFLVLLVSVWIGVKLYEQPGYILIYYRHYAIEMTFWFLCLLILLAVLLIHFLLNLLRGTVHLPERIETWWQNYKQNQAIKLFNKGFAELLIGREKKSEKDLLKSANNKDLAFVSYLVAAKAADEQQSTKKRDKYLMKAKEKTDKHRNVVDVMQVNFYLKNHQPEAALTLLLKLLKQFPKDGYLYKLMAEAYLQMQDWKHLQAILPNLKKYKVIKDEDLALIEKETYLHLLTDSFFSDYKELQTLWNKMPRGLHHDPGILIAYADHLKRWNRASEAEEVIRKALKKNFDNQLLEYFVTTQSKEPAKQIALGERYLKENTDNPASMRAMGILCLRNQLWGQARDYLENSLRLNATPEVYSALGYVYERMGDNDRALYYYRKGLSYLAPF